MLIRKKKLWTTCAMYDENENLLNEKFHYSSSISMIKFLELQRKKLSKINFHLIFINFAIFFRSSTMCKIRFSPEKLIYVYGKKYFIAFFRNILFLFIAVDGIGVFDNVFCCRKTKNKLFEWIITSTFCPTQWKMCVFSL